MAVFQLVVYAAMQIPVGILLDRYGAKTLLTVGALVMALGQLIVAFSPNLSTAVVGRMLVGMGDSFTFISLIRMINGWYTGAKASRLQQYISSTGQLGQFFSAVPFWFMLENIGWSAGFAIMATASLLISLLVILFTANEAKTLESNTHTANSLKVATGHLIENIKNPGIRMSFWTHFVTQPTTTSVALLWAVPFLVTAEGQSHDFAAAVLTGMVLLGFVTGPIIGNICARAPELRARLVYTVVALTTTAWIVLLSVPGRAPAWLLLICFLAISVGGPASMIAFDFSKDIAPKARLGTANGFANVGGFLATFIMMYLTGLVIDVVHGSSGSLERYTVEAFRWGFATQLLVVAVGITYFTIEKRKYFKIQAI